MDMDIQNKKDTADGGDIVRIYESFIRSRRRGAANPLIPPDHQVNWADAPSKFTIHLESVRLPLAAGPRRRSLPLGKPAEVPSGSGSQAAFLDDLSDLLLLTAGLLRRKLTINWTVSGAHASSNRNVNYSRGAASGGGLYPVSMYVVLGNQCGAPGVYHYDAVHNALTRLRRGDFESFLDAALDFRETSAGFWIVLTVRFWKNSFKYHNFGYQVMTQDVGATIGAIEQVAHSIGWKTTTIYWFRDRVRSSLLGLGVATDAPCYALEEILFTTARKASRRTRALCR
jgi:SagB-type dehydrogenase family enzyme